MKPSVIICLSKLIPAKGLKTGRLKGEFEYLEKSIPSTWLRRKLAD